MIPNRERILKALSICLPETEDDGEQICAECWYCESCHNNFDAVSLPVRMIEDVRTLLKAQEPRVMALDELPGFDGAFLIETRVNGATVWASWYAEYEHYGETVYRMVDIGGEVDDRFKKLYGYEWRCWTSRPTDEQREATPWE